ncbi:MAG: holo-ACP synthase [Gammaproteobacteria bacterium]|nr:holo-ACP synthase [Gammaproteobacteria bacterium]
MIYGIGVDLLRVARGEQLWRRFGDRAVLRLLHPQETAALPQAKSVGYALARAFAAKEAFVKALGTGFIGIAHHEIGALREPQRRPYLVFSPPLAARLQRLGIADAHLSLSDDGDYVLACVVLEGRDAAIR